MENQNQLTINEQTRQIIKQNLVRFRKANGLKMRDVAAALGIKENTYRVWEDPSKGCPKPVDLVKIARIYNVSLDLLITGKETVAKSDSYLNVSAGNPFDDIYGDKYLSTLSRSEKLIVMKIRRMNSSDRNQVNELIEKICEKIDQE